MNQKAFRQELTQWLGKHQYWFQYVGDIILTGQRPSQEQIRYAYNFLLEDNKLKQAVTSRLQLLQQEATEAADFAPNKITLKSIANVKNVNALAADQTIEFSENITILYGANGAGKTGYIRLFNEVFQSRCDNFILQNIFTDQPREACSADFVFGQAGNSVDKNYPSHKGDGFFKQFSVFDTASVRAHLDNENELSFVPHGFEFFQRLSDAFGQIESLLQSELTEKDRPGNFASYFQSNSLIAQAVKLIDTALDAKLIQGLCEEEAEEGKQLVELEFKKAQLITLDTEKQRQQYDKVIKSLLSTKEELKQIVDKTSELYLRSVKEDIESYHVSDRKAKEALADQASLKHISHLNSKEWKGFIGSAYEFAKLQYESTVLSYPKQGDSCIFCFQELLGDSLTTITAYWKILHSNAEEELARCVAKISKHQKDLEKIDISTLREDSFVSEWMSENKSEVLGLWQSWLDAFKLVKITITDSLTQKSWSEEVEMLVFDLESVDIVIQEVQLRVEELLKNDIKSELTVLNDKIEFLKERGLLRLMLSRIETHIQCKQWCASVRKSLPLLNTRKITLKQTELYEKLISSAYKAAFDEECQNLQAPFSIEINQRGEKGKTVRKLKVGSFEPKNVLSEGEQRAISMADFLCETRMNPSNMGIIFDDPVTSLDHSRKQLIAKRLVAESVHRQVVIFTHDLMFLFYLKQEVEAKSLHHQCHWVQKTEDYTGAVFLDNSPAHEGEYKTVSRAQKLYEASKKASPAEQQALLGQGFGALRTNYEHFVMSELFGNVILRFNERISIERLKDVLIPDGVVNQVIEKTGALSKYIDAHLHSDGYGENKPSPDDLKKEIEAFNAMRATLKDLKKEKAKATS